MPNKAEFARAIKEKYPEYKDVPDDKLVTAILEKYPEYRDQIDDRSLWQKANTPLYEGPTRLGKGIAETQYAEAETPGRITPQAFSLANRYMPVPPKSQPELKQDAYTQGAWYEGLGQATSGLTSPINLASMGLSKVAQLFRGLAGLKGVPSTSANPSQLRSVPARISQAANVGAGALAVPQIISGAEQVINAPNWNEKGAGALNATLGLMGARAGLGGVADIMRSRQIMDVMPPAPTFPLPRPGNPVPPTDYSPIYNGPAGTAPSGRSYPMLLGQNTVPGAKGRVPTEAAIRPVLPTKLELQRQIDDVSQQIRDLKIKYDYAKENDLDEVDELAKQGKALQAQYAELKAEHAKAPEIIPPNQYGTIDDPGEVINLPPDVAARYGTAIGQPEQLPIPHISGVPYDDTYRLWSLIKGLPADPSNATKIGDLIGQYNITDQDMQRILNNTPETPKPYGKVLNQPRQELLPPEPKLDMFGYPTDRDLTPEEVEHIKGVLSRNLMDSYGEDVVEGQAALDQINGIIDTTAKEPALNDPSGFILNPHQQPVINRKEITPPSSLFKAKSQNLPPDGQYSDIPIVNGYQQRYDRILRQHIQHGDTGIFHDEMQKLIHDLNESMKKNPGIARQLQDLQNEVIDKWNENPVRIGQNDSAINTNTNRWSNSDSPVVRDLANRANELVDTPVTKEGDYLNWTDERSQWLTNIDEEINIARMQGDTYRQGELEQLKATVKDSWNRSLEGNIQLDEPSFARTEKGKAQIGVNVRRAADELTSGYSNPLPAIMMREGLQNAIDAIKHLGTNGKINVLTEEKAIEISDNGKGMSRDELYTVYTNLHETGKANDEGAAGGKGIGKAPYMLGGSKFEVKTVKEINGKKIESSFGGTPEELLSEEGFNIHSRQVPNETPTGTWFRTDFKEGQERYEATSMLSNIINYSRDIPGTITRQYVKGSSFGTDEKLRFRKDDNVVAREPVFDNTSDIEIIIPKDEKLGEYSYIRVAYLNKGMYQFTSTMYLDEKVNGIPDTIIIDVIPKVEEGTSSYPFATTRESIKDNIKKVIEDVVKDKLVNPLANRKKKDLMKLWGQMPITGKVAGRDMVFFDPGDRLTASEREEFETNPKLNSLINQIGTVLDDILRSTSEQTWIDKVERVGITLDPNMYGVHIPNPASGGKKSAILLNPFAAMEMTKFPARAGLNMVVTALHEVAHVGSGKAKAKTLEKEDINDPRVGKYLATFLKEVHEQGGLDLAHDMNFLKRMGDVYASYGTRRALDAATKIESIIGDFGEYSSEIQRLLQIYSESRGRAATTEDILSGTGVKSEIKRGGETNLPSNDSGFGRGTIRVQSRAGSPVGRLAQALHAAKRLAPEQRELYAEERNRRIRAASKKGGTGRKWAYSYLKVQQGQLPKVEFEALKLNEADVDALFTMIKKSKNLSLFEKNGAINGLIKILGEGGGYLPQENEINKIARALGDSSNQADIDALVSALTAKKSLGAKTGDILVNNVVGAAKTAMAAFDMSAALRQALPSIHRKEWWKTFPIMWKAWAGSKGQNGQAIYDGVMQSIRENPLYDLATEAGVAFTDVNAEGITGREEQMVGSWLERIPSPTHVLTGKGNELSLYSRGIKGSNRAYSAFLNKLRMDVFSSMIKDYQASGLADKNTNMLFARQTAEYVNNTTGRGSLGKLEPAAKLMNVIFFSPRNMASRVNLLKKVFEPSFYTTLHPKVREEYLKSMFAWIAAGSVLVELARLIGAEVSNDPHNPDFRKAKIGKTRLDPYGGFQQYVVLACTVAPPPIGGTRTSSITGRSYQLGRGYGVNTRKDIMENFFVNKLSPEIRFAYMMWDAHTNARGQMLDPMGQPMNPYAEQAKMYIPLVAQDIYQVAQEDPLVAGILALPMFFGASVQEYAK